MIKQLTLLTILFLFVPAVPADSSNCSSNLSVSIIDFFAQINTSYNVIINDVSTDCSDDFNCWGGFTDVNIYFDVPPINITPESHILDSGFYPYYSVINSTEFGIYTSQFVFSGGGNPSCTYNLTSNFGNITRCSPPKKPNNVWVITDEQICKDRTICRQNSITINAGGSLTLQNTTLQIDLISLYNIIAGGYFVMDMDSLLIPPSSACPYKSNKPVQEIVTDEEVGFDVLPVLYLLSMSLLAILL